MYAIYYYEDPSIFIYISICISILSISKALSFLTIDLENIKLRFRNRQCKFFFQDMVDRLHMGEII